MARRYVIIGGGIAGTTAAEELRKLDTQAHITIIEQEFHPLYSRVLLPHYIKGKVPRERVFLKKPEWYGEKNIELMSGVIAQAIDTTNRFVTTSDGREIPYDALLITTGGELRTIDETHRGVCYLRGVDDADQILQTIKEVKAVTKNPRALVYGGGFIALEFINIFKHFDLPTTVLKRGDGFWSRTLGAHSKHVLAQHALAGGVALEIGVGPVEVLGEGDVKGLAADDGRVFDGQIVGVGIGLDRAMTFIHEAGIEVNEGILANEYLETNAQDVYTAGDIAQYDDVTVGRSMIAGNWMNALMQARAVARTMTGERTRFELVSSYATNLLGKEVVFVGDTDRQAADEVVEHVVDEESSCELFERDGRTVGAILIGETRQRQAVTNAIKKKEKY